tara:strand:+ start:4455 stop:4733 length:279 start_codon:yes stop_codon:yes gene_type:complete
MRQPRDVYYPKLSLREHLLESYEENTLGKCPNEYHYPGCNCKKWELDKFEEYLHRTNIVDYLVNGPRSVTPLHAKWCALKVELESNEEEREI